MKKMSTPPTGPAENKKNPATAVFQYLECSIVLTDQEQAARIQSTFQQHAGVVVDQKNNPSSTHAIRDHWDPAIEAGSHIVQVTPDWVYASIESGELQDEQRYRPVDEKEASQKRKKTFLQSLPEQKKKKNQHYYPKDAFEFKWFYSKQEAKDHYSQQYGPDAFWFKLGNTMFAAMPNRQALIDLCVEIYQQDRFLPPFYEVVHGEYCRLYLDIEVEYTRRSKIRL
jgi:hypothetical protein